MHAAWSSVLKKSWLTSHTPENRLAAGRIMLVSRCIVLLLIFSLSSGETYNITLNKEELSKYYDRWVSGKVIIFFCVVVCIMSQFTEHWVLIQASVPDKSKLHNEYTLYRCWHSYCYQNFIAHTVSTRSNRAVWLFHAPLDL